MTIFKKLTKFSRDLKVCLFSIVYHFKYLYTFIVLSVFCIEFENIHIHSKGVNTYWCMWYMKAYTSGQKEENLGLEIVKCLKLQIIY